MKPRTCTKRSRVNPTSISVKVGAQYPRGDQAGCHKRTVLVLIGVRRQKSAEGVAGGNAKDPNMGTESG